MRNRPAPGKDASAAETRPRWPPAALALIAIGAVVRALAIFPVTRFPADADCIQTGLAALRILDGDLRVFYNGVRIGAVESYLHALAFLPFGPSRPAMGIAPWLETTACVVVVWTILRALSPPRAALAGLLTFALPAPAVLFWTAQPNGYAMTLLLSAATLAVALGVARTPESGRLWLALGATIGLAWWASVQTVCTSLPALLWLASQSPVRRAGGPRRIGLALLGLAVGAAPWIHYNVRHPLASFRTGNSVSRPASTLASVADNGRYVATDALPELVASLDPEGGPNPPGRMSRALRPVVLGVHAVAAIGFFVGLPLAVLTRRAAPVGRRALERRRRRSRSTDRGAGSVPSRAPSGPPAAPPTLAGWWLALLIVAVTVAVNVASAAGSTRGLNVRYVLPIALVMPLALGHLFAWVGERSRSAAVALAVSLVAFGLSVYFWPWTPMRKRLAEADAGERATLAQLERWRVGTLVGEYWLVYPFNFVSNERIRGVPCDEVADLYGYGAGDALARGRWAYLDYDAAAVARRMATVPTPGHVVYFPPSFSLFLPESLARHDGASELPPRARLCADFRASTRSPG